MNRKKSPTIYILLYLALGVFFPTIELRADELDLVSEELASLPGSSTVVNVLSSEPSTGRVTTIEASGTWRNGCVPVLGSVELVSSGVGNGIILIAAEAEPAGYVCGQEETEWRFPVDVQFDLPGTYSVQLSITSVQLDTTELYASEEIVVSGHVGFSPQLRGANQSFIMTVTGFHYDDCVPEFVSHDVTNDTVIVEIMTPDSGEIICGQSQTPWQIDVDLAALDDGEYRVEVYRSDQYQGVATNRTMYKTAALSVGVGAAQAADHFIYLPNIVRGN